jgi:ATP-dependent Clp protease ATP-binding subunit ClpA
LHDRVVGQDEAINLVSQALLRSRVGLRHTGQPIGSFLFLGSTGVGKTELAKALAEQLFGSEKILLRFDMSEYVGAGSVLRLIGAPPRFVYHLTPSIFSILFILVSLILVFLLIATLATKTVAN